MPALAPRPPAALALALAAALALASGAGCDAVGPVNEPPPDPPTEPLALAALLGADGDFGALAALLDGRPLGAPGGLPGPLPDGATVFAPDDGAFALMSPETLAGLARQPGTVDRVLARHVVAGRVDPAALADGDALPTLEGTPLPVRVDDEGAVFVGGARVGPLVGTTPAGPVYRLSAVVRDHLTVRERLGASPLLARSLGYFDRAGVDLTGPGTYFVPLDAGYDGAPGGAAAYADPDNGALVAKTLRALVVPDEGLGAAELRRRGTVRTLGGTDLAVAEDDGLTRIGAAGRPPEGRVLVADLRARGAVVHLVGAPPQGHLTVLERLDFLPETASFAGLLRSTGAAAEMAGGAGGGPPYTVFAPTEAAFDSVGARGRAAIAGEPGLGGRLARFHVSPGETASSALVNGADLPTLAGEPVRVRPDPRTERVAVALARLGRFVDLPASDGRVHLAESFLNPSLSPYDQLALSAMGVFRAAVEVAGYRGLLEGAEPLTIVGPVNPTAQFLQPGFECRARELVEDHVTRGAYAYTPMAPGFTALSSEGNVDVVIKYNPNPFVLEEHTYSTMDVTVVQRGASTARYFNFPLPNGGWLHASERRMRWYSTGPGGGHTVNLPPCPQ